MYDFLFAFMSKPVPDLFLNIVLTDLGPLIIFMVHRLASLIRYLFGMLMQFSMFIGYV